jgi:C-terminal processing protease CtpA/Prc
MSGLFLTSDPPAYETIRVLAINAGTPAAAANLKIGDEIVAIDGKKFSLDETRAKLRVPGMRRIDVKRDGKPLQVKLEVQRLV